MGILKNKKIKFLIAAVVGFVLFFLGSLLYIYGIYKIDSIQSGKTFSEFYDGLNDNPLAMSIMQLVAYTPFLIVIIFLLKDDLRLDFYDFKRNYKKYIVYIIIGFISLIGCTVVVNIIYMLLGDMGSSENEELIEAMLLSEGAIPMIIAVVILAPVAEELLFRKIFFGVFEESFNLKPIIAITFSALLFAFIHVSDAANIKYIFQYLPLAFIMCAIYHYCNNNIYVSMLIHFLNNGFAVVMTYVGFYLGA